MIENLPRLAPDAARADRLRARCHDRLARQRHRQQPAPSKQARRWEPAIVGGLCLVYVSAVVITALQVLSAR